MHIAVLGTGMVGRAHAGKLAGLGHEVLMGTRDVQATLSRTAPDEMGFPPPGEWLKDNGAVKLDTFAGAAGHGEIVLNALNGEAAETVLRALGESLLGGKILIDITNPLDFSKGRPPTLFVSNTDSLGERIQRALPKTKVVKTLNTLTAFLQVEPRRLAGGDHDIFVSGDDPEAKKTVVALLEEWYGWRRITDLGDITTARGAEMILPLWVRLWGVFQTGLFNFKIVK
jgi:hypothetical protein